MRYFLFLFFVMLLQFEVNAKNVIAPNHDEYSHLNKAIEATQIDTNFFMTSITLQNNTDINQTYIIQSAQSGTNKITVYTKYEAIDLFSPLENTFTYFFSNILSHKILVPPHKSETIKYEIYSSEEQPILFVNSELIAQQGKVKTLIVLGVFYGMAITIVLYLTFLYFSTFKKQFIWFISYMILALLFLSHRTNLLWQYLPDFAIHYPLMFDDLLVILSIGAFVLLTIDITKPNKTWRYIFYSILIVKSIFHITAWVNHTDPVFIFSLSRKFSGIATLVFIPLFYKHFKNQKALFFLFFGSMLGIGGTNAYFNVIDYHSVIETARIYLNLLAPFSVHMIFLTGAFLLELQNLAEEKLVLQQNVNKIKKENHASFIKGTQTEQKNLADKIDHLLLQPMKELQQDTFVFNPQVEIEMENVSRDLKRIISGITPKNVGIEMELENIIKSVSSPEKYTLSVFHSEASLSNELQNVLIRITQEAVNNIEKHAHATQANIDFFKTNNTYFLSIYDNGIGFDPYQKNTGIGLKNMGKYIREQHGKLSVSSASNQGTTLLFSFKQEIPA